jgi:hypothetical protein
MPVGTRRPVICVGYRPTGGVLLAEDAPSGGIRLAWQAYNDEPVYGVPVAWDYGQAHRLELSAGSLLPPVRSGLWPAAVSAGQREERKRPLRVMLDGREVLLSERGTPDASPSSVVVGRNSLLISNVADSVYGEVISVKRGAW